MKTSTFKSYALLGSGRLARHFQFYLRQLDLPFQCWSRNGDPAFNTFQETEDVHLRLKETLADASHVLLAVKDSAVEPLLRALPLRIVAVHFSGALSIAGARGAHPLMTFGERLEHSEWYRRIPFVLDRGERLENVLPGFPNPYFSLAPEQKALYHALCSLAGNSTYLLWQNIGQEFRSSLGLPSEVLLPFLHQVVENALSGGSFNFTGPVARGDWNVVQTHLSALKRFPSLSSAYRSYLELATHSGYPHPKELIL